MVNNRHQTVTPTRKRPVQDGPACDPHSYGRARLGGGEHLSASASEFTCVVRGVGSGRPSKLGLVRWSPLRVCRVRGRRSLSCAPILAEDVLREMYGVGLSGGRHGTGPPAGEPVSRVADWPGAGSRASSWITLQLRSAPLGCPWPGRECCTGQCTTLLWRLKRRGRRRPGPRASTARPDLAGIQMSSTGDVLEHLVDPVGELSALVPLFKRRWPSPGAGTAGSQPQRLD